MRNAESTRLASMHTTLVAITFMMYAHHLLYAYSSTVLVHAYVSSVVVCISF